VAVVLISMGVNAGMFYFLHKQFSWSYMTAQLVTSGTVTLMNLVLYKKVVFYERRTRPLAP
jgi:putative flippase GtrA